MSVDGVATHPPRGGASGVVTGNAGREEAAGMDERGTQAPATMDASPWSGVLLPGSTHVELRFPVRHGDDRRTLYALGAEPLHADVRQVWFLDTDDLTLAGLGITVRASRSPHSRADLAVGLALERHRDAVTRALDTPGVVLEVEVGAQAVMPWCVLTAQVTEARLRGLLHRRLVPTDVLTPEQSALVEAGLGPPVAGWLRSALHALPAVNVLTRSYLPRGYSRRLGVESWFPPDGARRLALVTRCRPSSAPEVADATRRFLAARGVHLEADPTRTTTQAALLAASSPHGRS